MAGRALITGITGQDGIHLSACLSKLGYEVHGATRQIQGAHVQRLTAHAKGIHLHEYSLDSRDSLHRLVSDIRPSEIYHLAGPSFVPECVENPARTAELFALSTIHLLDAICAFDPAIRFFHSSSSEVFGDAAEVPQRETTPLRPLNAYGAAKAYAQWMVSDYRHRHGLFACNGILFNHESPLRNERFVTRKITTAVARIATGVPYELVLGDIESRRDWGYAGDYVDAMRLTLAYTEPGDYVIATGSQHSVREFAALAFACVGLDWRSHVKVDQVLCRRGDTQRLQGDPSKARNLLGWRPRTTFLDLVRMMVAADLQLLGAEQGLLRTADDIAAVINGTNRDLYYS